MEKIKTNDVLFVGILVTGSRILGRSRKKMRKGKESLRKIFRKTKKFLLNTIRKGKNPLKAQVFILRKRTQ